jgi:hypothetical protein
MNTNEKGEGAEDTRELTPTPATEETQSPGPDFPVKEEPEVLSKEDLEDDNPIEEDDDYEDEDGLDGLEDDEDDDAGWE